MVLEEFSMTREGTPRKETEEDNLDEFEELRVEEHKFGDYECPEIILSEKEEHKIYVPGKRGHREDARKKNQFQSPQKSFELDVGNEWNSEYCGPQERVLPCDFHK